MLSSFLTLVLSWSMALMAFPRQIAVENKEFAKVLSVVNELRREYNEFGGPAPRRLRKRIQNVQVTDISPRVLFSYQGIAGIGYPQQSFRMLFDTGSDRFWVRSGPCPKAPCPPSYQSQKSSTVVLTQEMAPTIRYSDGSHVNGSWIFERIQIADAVVPRHKIQMATSVVNVGEDDGIMGLGFSSNPSTPTFWEDYIRTNPSASPVFSYYIDLTETHGFITFGGMDLNRFRGPLYWAQGTALQNAWALELNSLIVGTRSIPLGESSLKVKVDTGTSLANFPNDIANALNQALGIGYVTLANGKSVRGVPCPSGVKPSLPSFTMNFGNVPLEFTPNEYLYYQVGTRDQILCLSGFIGADRRGSAVLGNVLLRRFYTVFDQSSRKIGFAIANRHTGVAANLAGGSSRNSPLGLA